MSTENSRNGIEELLMRLDDALADGAHDHDVESMSRIAIELGDQVRDRLDEEQRLALDTAISYWRDRRHDGLRLQYVGRIGSRRDAYVQQGAGDSTDACLNQLVWCALNTNTGLSVLGAEYLVDTAVGAAVPLGQIESSFQTVLPGLLQ